MLLSDSRDSRCALRCLKSAGHVCFWALALLCPVFHDLRLMRSSADRKGVLALLCMASDALRFHVCRALHRPGLPQSVRDPSFSSGPPMENRRHFCSISALDALDHRFLVCRLLGSCRWIWLALLSMQAIPLLLIAISLHHVLQLSRNPCGHRSLAP